MSSSLISSSSSDVSDSSPFDHIGDLRCPVTVVLGTASITVRQCLALGPQVVLRLEQAAGEDLRIDVNGVTIGTTTPQAPVSRTRLMFSPVFQGTRTKGTEPLAETIAKIAAAVSKLVAVCSNSTVSQSKPTRAIMQAAKGSGRVSQVPMLGWP